MEPAMLPEPHARRPEIVLRTAALCFAAGLALHTADHLRRGVDVLTEHVFWGGMVLTTTSVIAIVLVLTRHRAAPVIAAVVGFTAAIGVSAAHLLPTWSALSDSLPDGHVDVMSWVAVLIEIAGAVALGAAGLYALRAPTDRHAQPRAG
jgi:hypothetical protein